ncbi:Branched-chain-amino-acid aminotransferase, mitochondrial [Cytospora mali]|uniref:Branched-chain-amino-acid aminotransferase n=1 Tax=Cytospora mali TaxID=578113 RepID=A0A194WCX4_CYTMA|nr:Branched-chain-amino-acid aminotransferase, mitochondrial [Valsa mali]
MAPGTITPVSPLHDANASDVDLTSKALEHKLEQANGTTNGHTTAELDASKLTYTRTQNPRPVPDEETAVSGTETICTDHMITATWTASDGWSAPELKPYGPLSLMPTASCLHYATECFEGLKAYRGFDGKLRLFRPDCNARRFLMSSTRISLPAFPPEQLERLLLALLAVDGPGWLPRGRPGSFLYLRPAMIGTSPQLGVQAPSQALLFVTASFMRRFDTLAGGMRLHTSPEDQVRAWVGGFGYAKVGANYGPSLLATQEAKDRGFGQILWLYGPEGYCTEAGASNFFVVWRDKESGRTQIVTAPLDDRLILDGVTRRSVLQLARERLADEVEVVERRYTIDEVLEAEKEGRMVESFAAGTAYFVTPVSLIHHRGKEVSFDMGNGEGGKYTQILKKWMKDIMYGGEDHPWGVVIQEEE